MRLLNYLLFTITLVSVFSYSLAQKPGLVFHQLSTKDGLSDNTIRSIVEDKKGFMWFATEDGVNRYDGYEFKIYRSNPLDPYSISNTSSKCFYKDNKDNLWIGTVEGMNIYDSNTDQFYNFKSSKYLALKDLRGHMEMMSQDSKGNYWIVSSTFGLFKISDLNKKAKIFSSAIFEDSPIFSSLAVEDDQHIYIGTIDGLLRFNTVTEQFEDLRSKYGRGYQINKIEVDKEKKVLLGTTHGLKIIGRDGTFKQYLPIRGDKYSLLGNNVSDLVPYKNGNYLLAVDGGGIDYFDVLEDKFYHYTSENESQLSGNNVAVLYEDSKADLWVGTFLYGINFSNSTTNLFVLAKNNPSEESIRKGIVSCFHEDKSGNFWIATDGGGIYKKEKKSDKYINYHADGKSNSILADAVIAIEEDKNGILYFTSYNGGLSEYDPIKNAFKVYRHDVTNPASISNDKSKDVIIYQDEIWVSGFGEGISVLNKKTEEFHHYRYNANFKNSIPSDWVQCMYIDRAGTLWLATFNGLSKYIPEKNTFENYSFATELQPEINFIVDIIEDKFGNLWLGTMYKGIILFNRKDGSFKNFTDKNGLTDNNIKSVLEDDHENIWMTSNKGISKLHIPTMKFKSYTFKDGIPDCAFFLNSKFKDSEGKLYFGTNNGYMIIDPALTVSNGYVPPVVITQLKILNEIVLPGTPNSVLTKTVLETSEISLTYNQNSLSFEFAALNFNNSQNNQYYYLLEGFDQKWVKASHRFASYTNLNPGSYKFRVIASNNDNVWNKKGAVISIYIAPPFYKTWWFISFMVLVSIAALYLIYSWRLKNIKKKNYILEHLVKQRTSELGQRTQELKETNEQLETFVYKASHDIKGPLKSIIGLTTIGQKDVKDEVALSYFDHILKSTQKLDNLLHDLLEVTKVKQAKINLEEINFKDMVAEALASFENLPEYKSMKFSVNIKGKGKFFTDKKLLYSVIQNLVENPVKYKDPLKSENVLDIYIVYKDNKAKLIFKDNGIGIPTQYQDKIFDMFFKVNEKSNGTGLGMYIVKTTIEKLKGKIKMESKEGVGSTFIVSF